MGRLLYRSVLGSAPVRLCFSVSPFLSVSVSLSLCGLSAGEQRCSLRAGQHVLSLQHMPSLHALSPCSLSPADALSPCSLHALSSTCSLSSSLGRRACQPVSLCLFSLCLSASVSLAVLPSCRLVGVSSSVRLCLCVSVCVLRAGEQLLSLHPCDVSWGCGCDCVYVVCVCDCVCLLSVWAS